MTQALNEQLTYMKAAATQQTATYHTSRNQLHSAFVDAYLWWREAERQKGYLADIYKAASIKVRKRSGSNSPNFYPLVRLIWSIDITKQAGTVSNWARSLLALHVEYTNKPYLYDKNARADLLNYIKDNGGLGALRSDRKMTEQELEQEEREGIKKEKRGRPKRNAPPHASVTDSKIAAAKIVSAKATVASFPAAVTNRDDLVVMLGRRNAAGQIDVIGSDYSDELVQSALFSCTKLDRSTVTPSLRLIAEALEPHALPAKLEKYRKKFFDDSAVERTTTLKSLDENGQPETLTQFIKEAIRLRYRPQQKDFLISKATAGASIATYVRPHKAFDCDTEVILRGADRSWIEKELLSQQKLTLYHAATDFGLAKSVTKGKVRFELDIEDAAAEHKRSLYFDPKSAVPTASNIQPSIEDADALIWDWKLSATVQWLAAFDALCATPYIHKIRGFFNQTKYASIQLEIGKTDLSLRYWWDEKAKAYAETYALSFDLHSKRSDKKGSEMFTANAKDLALVFAVLPTLPITSKHVELAGNKNVMRISYRTELADYVTFIPSSNVEGVRDITVFAAYGA